MTHEITTERLMLRPLDLSDADRLAELVGDFAVARWLTRVRYPYTRQDAVQFIEDVACPEKGCFAITRLNELIGCISTDGELGYWIGRPFWGQGYVTEAARSVVSRYFDSTDSDLISGYLTGNTVSKHILLKLGFVSDGLTQCHSAALDHEVDNHRMRLTASIWRAVE